MCGNEKTTQTSDSNQRTTVEATPEEREMQRIGLEQYRQTAPLQTDVQKQFLSLAKALGQGTTELPGIYGKLAQGISPEAIGTQATSLALKALPQFQSLGLTESGVAGREISRGIANELLYPAEQFNIGSLQNLLNLALSGQAQVQAPVQASSNLLASSLAGLRSTQSSGTMTNTTIGMNPFWKSLQQSAGQGLGNFVNPQTYISPKPFGG